MDGASYTRGRYAKYLQQSSTQLPTARVDFGLFKLAGELDDLDDIDLQSTSIANLASRIEHVHRGFRLNATIVGPVLDMFRAVRVQRKPARVADVSYAPSSIVRSLGRVNAVGESIFYGSLLKDRPCLLECHAQPGEMFVVSHWQSHKEFLINHLGYPNLSGATLGSSGRRKPSLAPPLGRDSRSNLLRAWQAKVMTRTIGDSEPHLYKMGVALSKWALSVSPVNDEWEVESGCFGGIVYPSVANTLDSDNLAILRRIIDTCFALRHVKLLKIKAVRNVRLAATTLDEARHFTVDGHIAWKSESTYFKYSPKFIGPKFGAI